MPSVLLARSMPAGLVLLFTCARQAISEKGRQGAGKQRLWAKSGGVGLLSASCAQMRSAQAGPILGFGAEGQGPQDAAQPACARREVYAYANA